MDIWFSTGFFGELLIIVETEGGTFSQAHKAVCDLRNNLIKSGEYFMIHSVHTQPYTFKSRSEYKSL